MNNSNPQSTSDSLREQAQKESGSEVPNQHLSDPKNCEHLCITYIRATNVACALPRPPTSFYATVEIEGTIMKTSNKPISMGDDAVEWDDEILLPSNPSTVLSFEIHASFEFGDRLGNDELLWRFEATVCDLIDRNERLQTITSLTSLDMDLPSCSSGLLSITTERRRCDGSEYTTRSIEASELDARSRLDHMGGEVKAPNTSLSSSSWDPDQATRLAAHANLLYHRFQNSGDLADIHETISSLEKVIELLPDTHADKPEYLYLLGRSLRHRSDMENSMPDLETSISRSEEAVRLTPHGHPAEPYRLNNLSMSLYRRYERKYELADITRTISVKEEALRLIPDDPNKRCLLNSLGNSFFLRFEHLGELSDINQSILMLEECVRLTPDDYPCKLDYFNNLADSLLCRFECLSELSDITRAISMKREGTHLLLDDDPDKPCWLNALGELLLRRFEHSDEPADISQSISTLQEAVRLTPDHHPCKPGHLGNLGKSLLSRFELLGDLVDINQSILLYEEAICFTPDGHPDKITHLKNQGKSLLSRFEHLNKPADISQSISVFEEVLRLTPDDDPYRPCRLDELGKALLRRFKRCGNLADVEESISKFEEAVRLTPDGHSCKAAHHDDLGHSLLSRFEHQGDIADITLSISEFQDAVRLTHDNDPFKPCRLNNLGNAFSGRFERLGDLADLSEAISVNEEAVHLTPDGDEERPGHLSNLGSSLLIRFERLGGLADIAQSVFMFEEAVRLTPPGDPDRPCRLNNLGTSLSSRFERFGSLVDITRCISTLEEAVRLTPDGHTEKPSHLNGLGNSFLSRFERLGELADITLSISAYEEAVRLLPDNHPSKPCWLNNLGNSLTQRFKRLGELADINQSIDVFEEAIRLTPGDHPCKAGHLNNQGISFSNRFRHLGKLEDITQSISITEEALRLIPDDHPDTPNLLMNLGTSLGARFQHLRETADITQSISILEKALRLTPDGHPTKPAELTSLGGLMELYWEHFHDLSSLLAATSHYSAAAKCSTGPTSDRFVAACAWISVAHLPGNSDTLLDAYDTAICLLPHLAWLGLPLTDRHRHLIDAANIARDAATAALEAGSPKMAVEWLEAGRSVVWTQFLQLRSPVDKLREKHPVLADEFARISHELERASSRNNEIVSRHLENVLDRTTPSPDEVVRRHHQLAVRREELLSEIRDLQDFDGFLLPKKMHQLTPLAHSGLVVYLNAGEHRCDAMIVMAETQTVTHVTLPDCDERHVRAMLRLLFNRNDRTVVPDDDLLLIPSVSGDAMKGTDREGGIRQPMQPFERVLEFLWLKVARPILNALGFSSPPSCTEKMPRVFWCPTGPFSFLPIHAAGLYSRQAVTGTRLSDFVISSYIPTVSALTPSAEKGDVSNIRLLAVPQPKTDGQFQLKAVRDEIDYIKSLPRTSSFVTVQESDGTVDDVVTKMTTSDWVHFACHGIQDHRKPLESGVCLADRLRLKLSDVIRLSRPQGGLAFLSACQTAQGEESLSEESVHLAAGMLLAGYGGVIGTMWTIQDKDAPKVTKDIYDHLFRDRKVPDITEAAEALHHAVKNLRDSGVPFSSWVPFIHVGR